MLVPQSAWLYVLLSREHWLNVKEMYLLELCCHFLFLVCVLIMGTATFLKSSIHNEKPNGTWALCFSLMISLVACLFLCVFEIMCLLSGTLPWLLPARFLRICPWSQPG